MTQIAMSGENPSLNPPSSVFPNSFLKWLESKKTNHSFTKKELESLRKEYRRLYHKAYYKKRKKNSYHLVVRMTKKEYMVLQGYAKEHNKSLNKFIKEIAFAYLENGYLPRDAKQLTRMENEIRSIGNNINQVVRRIHQLKYEKSILGSKNEIKGMQKLYETLLDYVVKIEMQIKENFKSTPQSLQQGLLEFVQIRSDKIDDLIIFLEKEKLKVEVI